MTFTCPACGKQAQYQGEWPLILQGEIEPKLMCSRFMCICVDSPDKELVVRYYHINPRPLVK